MATAAGRAPYGVGIGGGAGCTIEQGVYFGNQADYYFGAGGFSAWSVLLQVGYDFGFGDLLLRPVLGLGAANVTLDACEGDACEQTDFAFGVGAQAYFFLTDYLNLGFDCRAILAEGDFLVTSAHLGVAF